MPQPDSKSFSGQEQQQTAQMAPYPQHFENDTIDLYELCVTLWKRKWLVIAVTLVSTLGSIVYALQLQRVYKAETLLHPPKAKDFLLSLNVLGLSHPSDIKSEKNISSNLTGISASAVFNKFKQNLNSRTLHKKFIQENGLMDLLAPERTPEIRDEVIYQQFAELINIEVKNGTASLSIELPDPEIATQWVNDLTEFVDKETIAILVEELQIYIASQVRDIEYQISSKRQMAKQRREDTITRYREAAFIAQKLGVMDRIDSTNIVQNNRLNITTTNIPLYFRGYRALNAEILFLNSRESDDPFVSGLRVLQERLTLLRNIKFDKEKMSAVYIDQAAYPPNNHIKPKRRLIVSLATVIGLFSGIFLAFFIGFVKNQRKIHSE